MKYLTMVAGCLLAISASSLHAQTCASPIALTDNANVSGDTCTSTNSLGNVCISANSSGNDIVYSVNLASGYSATNINLTNNSASWDAGMVLMTGACGPNSPCPRNADATGAGGNESLDISGLAPGSYFMVVTAKPGTSGCGAFDLAVNGTLPVKLQSFSVN